ncbi:hypothetical protein trd_0325 [Thermomicrobium roseum DSM 5159]|uniref:Uncharacterized protein n=1 Tax=Thermomicrobium roseum (strain ATCC 27502 / DSM 5159 / P-2) TaxID=309801 RepID=B9KXY3_THERP|nr:hypothetical protein trd_0325 [Thermomicrobium roseum DSM 5159]
MLRSDLARKLFGETGFFIPATCQEWIQQIAPFSVRNAGTFRLMILHDNL